MSGGYDAINTLRQRQNGRHFTDDIFKCIFLNENVLIPIKISLKFVPKGQINKIPVLVQIMAWRRPGDKPLSEPMMVSLLTHICVIRPQWVNIFRPEQNAWHSADKTYKCIFSKRKCISIQISLHFFPLGLIVNKTALVWIMNWHQHVKSHYLNQCWQRCPTPNGIIRPQWINPLRPGVACISYINQRLLL